MKTLTRLQVARALGVSLSTLDRRRREKLVPEPLPKALHAGSRWRADDIELFLAVDGDIVRFRREKRDRDRAVRQRQRGIIPPEISA